MPISFEAGAMKQVIFTGRCAPEEADALLEWLRATPDAGADLGACDTLHTALAQLLMAARVRLLTPPADTVLADCLCAGGCERVVADAPPMKGGQQSPHASKRSRRGKTAVADHQRTAGSA